MSFFIRVLGVWGSPQENIARELRRDPVKSQNGRITNSKMQLILVKKSIGDICFQIYMGVGGCGWSPQENIAQELRREPVKSQNGRITNSNIPKTVQNIKIKIF